MSELTLQQLLDHGLTLRQLEHWVARDLLRPITFGHGVPRQWPQEELRVADLMRRLVTAGFTAEAAARAARAHLAGRPLVPLVPGVVLAIDTDLLTREET
ncbi:MerR family transcriptional regulator [Nonomuraea turcica]|uniref:MerR family transcriptional regulator n=1 Tax=Nonomuraea sp. G32 TaxID=3067274 RepID=UPI00273C287A|nr:MerR family transcriptional regulator [Nonomuraea sp. G32]MDP4501027.1 MerR family transcriptional regulator [Nonomuraea sp. G32]